MFSHASFREITVKNSSLLMKGDKSLTNMLVLLYKWVEQLKK